MRTSLVVVLLALAARAHAAPQCMPVAQFNTYMDQQTSSANDVTLSYTVTGVNLDDYTDGKGWLAELGDSRCAAGYGAATLKVYGTNGGTAHPSGTVKLEYGSACCPAGAACPVERWADPNPGPKIFNVGSDVCAIVVKVNPNAVSYDITCNGGTAYHGTGLNTDQMPVNKIALLREVAGGHAMPNATASNDMVCFQLAGPPVNSQKITVAEDAMVNADAPASVVPVSEDLACGVSDGWVYLKFDLRALAGQAAKATLYVHSATGGSAAGDGGDVKVVGNAWSEGALTWNNRPMPGASAGRISAVAADQWYAVDVTAQVKDPALYSFALVPAAADQNGAHFWSKELSPTLASYLLVQVLAVDGDGDGSPKGPDCNDGDPAIHAGAPELCNGIDDNCDGTIDEGCGTPPGMPGSPDGQPDGGTQIPAAPNDPGAPADLKGGCSAAGASAGSDLFFGFALLGLFARRARRVRPGRN